MTISKAKRNENGEDFQNRSLRNNYCVCFGIINEKKKPIEYRLKKIYICLTNTY